MVFQITSYLAKYISVIFIWSSAANLGSSFFFLPTEKYCYSDVLYILNICLA